MLVVKTLFSGSKFVVFYSQGIFQSPKKISNFFSNILANSRSMVHFII